MGRKPPHSIALALALTSTACSAPPANQTQGAPPAVASGALLSPNVAVVDTLFAEFDHPGSPGCALGVSHLGELLFEAGYGTADLDHDVAITPDTVFDIGSVSKQFTAASIVLLSQRGELGLDDDARSYFPEIPDYGDSITLRQLIHHTSGIRDYLDIMSIAGRPFEDNITDLDIVGMAAQQRSLNFRPGTQYSYSNTGYMLLGVVVHQITGVSLGEFAEREIFLPLGMGSSLFYEDKTVIIPNRATGYGRDEDSLVRQTHNYDFAVAGDGQLYTTVGDLLRWNRNFEEPTIGGADFNNIMLKRGVLNSGEDIDYAFALGHSTNMGLATISHSGSSWGFRAYLVRYPEPGLSIAVLCNSDDANPTKLAHRIAGLFLQGTPMTDAEQSGEPEGSRLSDDTSTPSATMLRGLTGEYFSEELNVTHEITVDGTGLLLRIYTERGEYPRLDLKHQSGDTFRSDGYKVHFDRGNDGEVISFTLSTSRARGFRFERL